MDVILFISVFCAVGLVYLVRKLRERSVAARSRY